MSRCEVCGNDYDKTMTIRIADEEHVFDSFECAIHMLAPRCGHCGCMIVGHGMEVESRFFCCAHCANLVGAALKDRA